MQTTRLVQQASVLEKVRNQVWKETKQVVSNQAGYPAWYQVQGNIADPVSVVTEVVNEAWIKAWARVYLDIRWPPESE